MRRAKIGDIIELPTNLGLVYGQYTHDTKDDGEVLRILDEVHECRPDEFSQIVNGPLRFTCLFLVKAAVNRKLCQIVANLPIREDWREFPLFRWAGLPNSAGKVDVWFLWDGVQTCRKGKLNDEEKRLPIKEFASYPLLIERIETNWRPETDPETTGA